MVRPRLGNVKQSKIDLKNGSFCPCATKMQLQQQPKLARANVNFLLDSGGKRFLHRRLRHAIRGLNQPNATLSEIRFPTDPGRGMRA